MFWIIVSSILTISYAFVCNYNNTLYTINEPSDKIVWNKVYIEEINCTSFAFYSIPFNIHYHIECLEDPVQANFTKTTKKDHSVELSTLIHAQKGIYQFLAIHPIAHLYTACVRITSSLPNNIKMDDKLIQNKKYKLNYHPLQRIMGDENEKENVIEHD